MFLGKPVSPSSQELEIWLKGQESKRGCVASADESVTMEALAERDNFPDGRLPSCPNLIRKLIKLSGPKVAPSLSLCGVFVAQS